LQFLFAPFFSEDISFVLVRFDISLMPAKKTAAKAKSGDAGEQLSFEDALEALEELVAEMEEKEMPLDTMIANYEKGVRLRGFCERHIEDAQLRIERIRESGGLSLKGDSKVTLEDFDATDEQTGTKAAAKSDSETQSETGGSDGELF
jgi:exodeoxyribonuclease VII small subunit